VLAVTSRAVLAAFPPGISPGSSHSVLLSSAAVVYLTFVVNWPYLSYSRRPRLSHGLLLYGGMF